MSIWICFQGFGTLEWWMFLMNMMTSSREGDEGWWLSRRTFAPLVFSASRSYFFMRAQYCKKAYILHALKKWIDCRKISVLKNVITQRKARCEELQLNAIITYHFFLFSLNKNTDWLRLDQKNTLRETPTTPRLMMTCFRPALFYFFFTALAQISSMRFKSLKTSSLDLWRVFVILISKREKIYFELEAWERNDAESMTPALSLHVYYMYTVYII